MPLGLYKEKKQKKRKKYLNIVLDLKDIQITNNKQIQLDMTETDEFCSSKVVFLRIM